MPEFLFKKSWANTKTSIHAYDIINEAHDWANELKYEPQQMLEITGVMSQALRQADPTAFRILNIERIWQVLTQHG